MSFGFGFGLPSWQTLSGGFSPASLFSAGENGAWYDPSDFSTLFTDSAGTTPVTAVEQFVGLMLDKSKGLNPATKGGVSPGAAGSGFISPDSVASSITGDIDIRVQVALVDWTPSTGQALVSKDTTLVNNRSYDFNVDTSGTLSFVKSTDGTTIAIATSSIGTGFTDGSTNWVRATYATSTGNVNFFYSSDGVNWTQLGTTQTITSGAIADTTAQLAVGIYANEISNPTNGKFYRAQIYSGINGTLVVDFNPTRYASGSTFTAATGEVWTIKGTARIVPDGNHATSTGTKRPKLAARYNLLTYTEQFDNAAWNTNAGVTVTPNTDTAPDGTLTADTVTSANGSTNSIYRTTLGAGNFTLSISVKKTTAATRFVALGWYEGGHRFSTLNTNTGVIGSNAAGNAATVVSSGDYWFFTVTRTTAAGSEPYFISSVNSDGSQTATAGAGSAIIWGADLRPASQATGLIGPTYQRVVDAATYDAVGFLPYLEFNGLSWSMSTGSIVPGTDKAQVFVGLRKLSDATQIIAELSVDANSNNGSIASYVETANVQYGLFSKGTNAAIASINSGFAAPNTVVFTGIGDISGDVATLRLNGAQAATSSADQGAGDYLTYPLFIGGRNNASLFFQGWLSSLIVRFGANLTQSQIEATESWVNQKTGAF